MVVVKIAASSGVLVLVVMAQQLAENEAPGPAAVQSAISGSVAVVATLFCMFGDIQRLAVCIASPPPGRRWNFPADWPPSLRRRVYAAIAVVPVASIVGEQWPRSVLAVFIGYLAVYGISRYSDNGGAGDVDLRWCRRIADYYFRFVAQVGGRSTRRIATKTQIAQAMLAFMVLVMEPSLVPSDGQKIAYQAVRDFVITPDPVSPKEPEPSGHDRQLQIEPNPFPGPEGSSQSTTDSVIKKTLERECGSADLADLLPGIPKVFGKTIGPAEVAWHRQGAYKLGCPTMFSTGGNLLIIWMRTPERALAPSEEAAVVVNRREVRRAVVVPTGYGALLRKSIIDHGWPDVIRSRQRTDRGDYMVWTVDLACYVAMRVDGNSSVVEFSKGQSHAILAVAAALRSSPIEHQETPLGPIVRFRKPYSGEISEVGLSPNGAIRSTTSQLVPVNSPAPASCPASAIAELAKASEGAYAEAHG